MEQILSIASMWVWDWDLIVWTCVPVSRDGEEFCSEFSRECAKFCLMAEVCRYSTGWFKAKPRKMRRFSAEDIFS